jgi:hypothetical protein
VSNKINERLGLKPSGKRAMMNLPTDRSEASDLTSAKCPVCGLRGAIENVIHGQRLRMCTWCSESWTPEPRA